MHLRAGLANHLRNLSQDEFMSLVRDIYRILMSGVERIKAQGEVISELLDSLKYAFHLACILVTDELQA